MSFGDSFNCLPPVTIPGTRSALWSFREQLHTTAAHDQVLSGLKRFAFDLLRNPVFLNRHAADLEGIF